jgi:hypothetical protein
MTKICILGAGSWGTAQAIHLHQNGARIVSSMTMAEDNTNRYLYTLGSFLVFEFCLSSSFSWFITIHSFFNYYFTAMGLEGISMPSKPMRG